VIFVLQIIFVRRNIIDGAMQQQQTLSWLVVEKRLHESANQSICL